MSPSPSARVFLDTSAMVAAILSSTGGARLLLKLGEAGTIRIVVGPRVLAELDGVIERKAPAALPQLALLLDASNLDVSPQPPAAMVRRVGRWLEYAPDAHVLAEAMAARADYFVTLDREHFLGNPRLRAAPLAIGTPGDCIAWLRNRLAPALP